MTNGRILIIAMFLVVALSGTLTWLAQGPDKPTVVVSAEVIALEEGKDGWRTITVRFENGEERSIVTLAPFFFKVGYKARVGIFDRVLFEDRYDIVGDWTAIPNP